MATIQQRGVAASVDKAANLQGCVVDKAPVLQSPVAVDQALIKELRELGNTHYGKSADGYFSHTSGRVHLAQVRTFYGKAVELAERAAEALVQHQCLIHQRVSAKPSDGGKE